MGASPVGGWRDGNLTFRYATLGDLVEFGAMLAKPNVTEHVFFGPNSPEETRAFFAPLIEPMTASIAAGEQPTHHIFAVRDEHGALVGECALLPPMFSTGHFEIGYQLDDAFWRRGYGTQMAELVVWFGFHRLGAHRLSAETLASNRGSCRILEKLGFAREGTQKAYYSKGGAHLDRVLFGLRREDAVVDLDAVGARLAVLP